jgi:hypothetical protein
MKVVACKPRSIFGKTYGYTIEHGQPIGWKGTTGRYVGWYRYKRDANERLKELINNF